MLIRLLSRLGLVLSLGTTSAGAVSLKHSKRGNKLKFRGRRGTKVD